MSGSASRLESEWLKDTARFASPAAGNIFRDILDRHAEPHRRCHGPEHLVALLDLLDRHAPHIAPGSAPRLAVCWREAVYDPTRKDNEEKSSDLAYRRLADLLLPKAPPEQVCQLIEATKNHWDGPSMGEGDHFLDADIAILGAPLAVYDAYAAGVRTEYSWAPEPAYRVGRAAFLTAAIARPRLFRTDAFRDAHGAQALTNMRRELASLAGPSP